MNIEIFINNRIYIYNALYSKEFINFMYDNMIQTNNEENIIIQYKMIINDIKYLKGYNIDEKYIKFLFNNNYQYLNDNYEIFEFEDI